MVTILALMTKDLIFKGYQQYIANKIRRKLKKKSVKMIAEGKGDKCAKVPSLNEVK
jgi:hypothetical protein